MAANGRVTLEVPPGAVTRTTTFQHTERPDLAAARGLPYAFALEAESDGRATTTFARPLTLTYAYERPVEASGVYTEPSLFYLDEAGGRLVEVAARRDFAGGRLIASLDHFTLFYEDSTSYIAERLSSLRGAQTKLFTLSAAYGYDLAVPPGPGGWAPTLRLAYSSANHVPDSGHFSHVGYGWELAGADGVYIPPGDENLGKPVLTLQGATYSLRQSDDGTWFAKEDPFLRIEVGDKSQESFGRWEVWTPDGRKYEFLGTVGSDVVGTHYWKFCSLNDEGKRWVRLPLRSVTDPSGNQAVYTWATETLTKYNCPDYNRATRLTEISYNGGNTRAVLTYASRLDRPDGYDAADWKFYTDRKLTSVEVQVKVAGAWQTARTYSLTHAWQDDQHPHLSEIVLDLAAVTELAQGQQLPATTFSYPGCCYHSLEFGAVLTITNGYGGEVAFGSESRYQKPSVVLTRTERSGASQASDAAWLYSGFYWDDTGASQDLAQGFRQVQITRPDGVTETHSFHTILHAADGEDIDHLAGREYLAEVWQGGQSQSKVESTWVSTTIGLPISGYSGMADNKKPRFIYLAQSDSFAYASGAAARQDRATHTYDSYGNPVQVHEYGDVTISSDDRYITNTYVYSTTPWIVNTLSRQQTYGADGTTELARTDTCYDRNADGTLRTWGSAPTKGLVAAVRRINLGSSPDSVTEYLYDTYGNRTVVTDALGYATRTFYDPVYHVYPVTVTNALTQSVVYGYDFVLGKVLTETDANSEQTFYAYDAFGRPTKVARPGDSLAYPTVEYTYAFTSPFRIGIFQRETSGSTGTLDAWRFYDGLGQLVQTQGEAEDGQVVVQNTAFDGLGRVTRQGLPYFATSTSGAYITPSWTLSTSYQYDALGRTTVITNPDGTSRLQVYSGWTITSTDENGHQRVNESDAFGRLTVVKEFTGTTPTAAVYATTTYAYDALGSLTRVTDTLGNSTVITYNALGLKTAMTDPDMGTWQYGYDAAGRLVTQTDALSQVLWFGYDALGRMTEKREDDSAGALLAAYGYDQGDLGIGRRTAMTDTSAITWWEYDARGQVVKETRNITVTTGVTTPTPTLFTTLYAYDAAGRTSLTTYPDGEVLAQAYNARGLELSVGQYVVSTTYNALGQPVTRTYGNETTTAYTYDPQNQRLSGIASAEALTLTYGYDAVGNVTTITDTSNSGQVLNFTYDPLDRLTRGFTTATGSGQYDESYAYNAIGNLTSKGGSSYTYGDPDHVRTVTQAGGNSYTYDANGNTVTRPDQTLSWDAENRLVQVVSGTITTTMGYDGDGKRVTLANPDGVTLFVSPAFEVNVPVTATQSAITATVYPTQTYKAYFPLVTRNGCEVPPGAEITKYYFAGGQRVAVRVAQLEPAYLYQDHLGSASLAVGTSTTSQRYLPYGTTRDGGVPTDYQFTGQKRDAGTELYYYGARYYDPATGRFISADPAPPSLADPQTRGRYAYGRNNPLRFTDPTGLKECETYNGDCLSNEWPWKNRWYNAHGYFKGADGAWSVKGDPIFADESIMDEVIGEAGISLSDKQLPWTQASWSRSSKANVASGVAKLAQSLTGGMAALASLLGGPTTVYMGWSPVWCNWGGNPCAPGIPYGSGNTVYLRDWSQPADVVHELAHVIDWHSGPPGTGFSMVWPYPALTDYATNGYGDNWRWYHWDRWAEAVTIFVFDDYKRRDDARKGLDPNYLEIQMGTVRDMLEGW